MGYNTAFKKAWLALESLSDNNNYSVKFLNGVYNIDLREKRICCESGYTDTKEFVNILILHYIARKLKGFPALKGEWISFKELPGGQGYYPTFKKRVIDVLLKKYGADPDAVLNKLIGLNARTAQLADVSIIIDVFDKVPLLINFWRGDTELRPSANILFDKSITEIFCTEDIAVLSEHAVRII